MAESRDAGHLPGLRPAPPTGTGTAENVRSAEVENRDIWAWGHSLSLSKLAFSCPQEHFPQVSVRMN